MSDPGNGTGMALQYVREELAGLRNTMNDSLGGLRADLATLAGELRGFVQEHGPAFAVIQHRLAEAEKDIAALSAKTEQAEKDREASDAQARRDRVAQRWALGLAVLGSVLAWVLPLIAK